MRRVVNESKTEERKRERKGEKLTEDRSVFCVYILDYRLFIKADIGLAKARCVTFFC